MDIVMIILRILHIFAGVYWVGAAILTTMILSPTIVAAGNSGTQVMRGLLMNKAYTVSFPIVAVTTVLSGIAMFYKTTQHFDADFMGSINGIVLSIGGLCGILAAGHGGASLGPAMGRYEKWASGIGAGGATPEQQREGAELNQYLDTHGKISLALMLIALFGMATFRYF